MYASQRRETRYGNPQADQILYNRFYVLGYSYYFRQAKWALEIVNSQDTDIDRLDNFRADLRIPPYFRADLVDYKNSGYDRGHLIASANQIDSEIQNSETFLLSNMSPQAANFNRKVWRELESRIRRLNSSQKVFETYVICGPVFYFDKEIKCIGIDDKNEVTIPIPHAFFKSVLTENKSGSLNMWSFIIPNENIPDDISNYGVTVAKIEKIVGLHLWDCLRGNYIEKEKNKIRKLWK